MTDTHDPTKLYRSFDDIPRFTSWGNYQVTQGWVGLKDALKEIGGPSGLDFDPDYQRGHVWSEVQQVRYVEYILRGGRSGRDIMFNAPDQNPHWEGPRQPVEVVDGKQRLTAVLRFMANEIPAFGRLCGEYEGRLNRTNIYFNFHINDLMTREEVLQWYLDINSGGVVHTDDELERVRDLLRAEQEQRAGNRFSR
jgi:hypothetical protein